MTKRTRKSYTVLAEKHGRWWGLTVPDVPGVVSQVRSLEQAEEYAREAIAFVAGVAEDSFDVVIEPVLPGNVLVLVHETRELQDQAEALQREAASRSRQTVGELIRAGLTGADAARVLGVSPQRVSQLVAAKTGEPQPHVRKVAASSRKRSTPQRRTTH